MLHLKPPRHTPTLRTPAIAGPSNDRRGPYGRKRSGQFRIGRRGPLLSLSAVPVHPSLMRQFQFQSRLRITETGTVSQIPILAMETISQSQRATHMTPLTPCQQYQGVPSLAAGVPRSRDLVPTSRIRLVV